MQCCEHRQSALIRLGDSHVQQEAVKRFEMFVKKPSTLPADLREPVYSAYAWVKNSPAAYAKLERMYSKKQDFYHLYVHFATKNVLTDVCKKTIT